MGAMFLNSALLLTACSTDPDVLPSPRLVYTCPQLVMYDNDQLKKIRYYYSSLEYKYPELASMISDYLSLRDSVRRCQNDATQSLIQTRSSK